MQVAAKALVAYMAQPYLPAHTGGDSDRSSNALVFSFTGSSGLPSDQHGPHSSLFSSSAARFIPYSSSHPHKFYHQPWSPIATTVEYGISGDGLSPVEMQINQPTSLCNLVLANFQLGNGVATPPVAEVRGRTARRLSFSQEFELGVTLSGFVRFCTFARDYREDCRNRDHGRRRRATVSVADRPSRSERETDKTLSEAGEEGDEGQGDPTRRQGGRQSHSERRKRVRPCPSISTRD